MPRTTNRNRVAVRRARRAARVMDDRAADMIALAVELREAEMAARAAAEGLSMEAPAGDEAWRRWRRACDIRDTARLRLEGVRLG